MSFTLACYYPAEEPLFFSLVISPKAWVSDLLEGIGAKLHLHRRFRGVNVDDLRLFKTGVALKPNVSLQSRVLQWLHGQQVDGHMKVTQRLSRVFPDGPDESDDDPKLDIIVSDAEVLELVEDLGDPDKAYKRKIRKALDEQLNSLSTGPSPSDVVQNASRIAELLGGNQPPICMGRPGGAPAVIYNTALATLQWRLDHLEEIPVSRQEVERAALYIHYAVTFYDHEPHRLKVITELVDKAIGAEGEWGCALSWADNIKPNGCWWCGDFLLLVVEFKKTLGLSGDALLQAVVDYSKIVSRNKYKPYRDFCNFPVVLVGATANRLEISVAVCVGPIYMTRLLALDLTLGFHASDNIIRLARVFGALSRCRDELKIYYDEVRKLSSPRLACLFPNPTILNPSKSPPGLTYWQFLSRAGQPMSVLVGLGNTTTAMYTATLDSTGQEVIVKFTARYNEEAHKLLADANLAPTLRFCGRIIGDLYMVVMDRVDGKSIWQLQQDNMPIPRIILQKVREAVDILHKCDFVFGDLSDPNILYNVSDNSMVLVDFDWPGKDGESRYPPTLNPSNAWAEDVAPYGVMRKSHDLWQVERLERLCIHDA